MTGSPMTRRRAAAPLAAALIAMVAPNLAPRSAHAQLTVYDPSNHAQNVLTAARTLQQVNNQIAALQNQAQMLSQQALHLKTLDYSALAPMRDALQQLNALMTKADGVALNLRATETALGQMFDGLDPAATTSQTAVRARDQAVAALEAYRRTLRVQAQVVENIQADAPLIADLVSQSQGSAGSLQAQQAANQLQALAVKQEQQLQSLMVAQYRADALERARQAQALEAGKLATRRFLGEPQAYTPASSWRLIARNSICSATEPKSTSVARSPTSTSMKRPSPISSNAWAAGSGSRATRRGCELATAPSSMS